MVGKMATGRSSCNVVDDGGQALGILTSRRSGTSHDDLLQGGWLVGSSHTATSSQDVLGFVEGNRGAPAKVEVKLGRTWPKHVHVHHLKTKMHIDRRSSSTSSGASSFTQASSAVKLPVTEAAMMSLMVAPEVPRRKSSS